MTCGECMRDVADCQCSAPRWRETRVERVSVTVERIYGDMVAADRCDLAADLVIGVFESQKGAQR